MKKTPFLLIITLMLQLFFVNCSSDEPVLKNNEQSKNVFLSTSKIRTISEAAEIADEAIGSIYGTSSRANASKTFNTQEVKIVASSKSRSLSDTLMYVFNFENDEGFAIIAANKNITPVIAITESGNYDPNEDIENPGFKIYMERACSFLEDPVAMSSFKDSIIPDVPGINENDTVPPSELAQYKSERRDIYKLKIEPNYNLQWGQKYPEGELFHDEYFTNGTCGCTNTAMLIVMSYFKPGINIQLTYPTADQPYLFPDWESIILHSKYYDYCSINHNSAHKQISMICRQLAQLNSSFQVDNVTTGTHLSPQAGTLRKLGFRVDDYTNFTKQNAYNTICNGGKIIMYGASYEGTGGKDSAHELGMVWSC